MADLDVDREGSRVRPWIVGLVVLGFLMWGITQMIGPGVGEVARVEEAREADASATEMVTQPAAGEPQAPQLTEILPLGPEDEGERVRVSGDVVGDPIPEGHWVLTDVDEVVFVRTDRPVATGQNVTALGVIQPVPEGQAERWIVEAKLREAAGWVVHRELHLDAGELERGEEGVADVEEDEPIPPRR